MPDYTNYKVKGINISDILEKSENRYSSFNTLRFEFSGFYDQHNHMDFALYVPDVHPFNYNTDINYYYSNYVTEINKKYIPKGYAPLLTPRYESGADDGGKEILISYRNTGSRRSDFGELLITTLWDNGQKSSRIIKNCPTCIIVGIIGAGGGGAGGYGNFWNPWETFGGGCGPFVALHVELPYLFKRSSESKEWKTVLDIYLGSGGLGGSPSNRGEDGDDTRVYFESKDSRVPLILHGGRGGRGYDSDTSWGKSTELAITTADLGQLDLTTFGSEGWGRVTICNSVRDWSKKIPEIDNDRYGAFSYMPGNYYHPGMDDSYNQYSYKFGPLTSAKDAEQNSYIYSPAMFMGYSESEEYRNNKWFIGKHSLFGRGGTVSNDANGGNGGIGAGGGAGKPGGFTSATQSSGGNGGPAGFKIYW